MWTARRVGCLVAVGLVMWLFILGALVPWITSTLRGVLNAY